MFTGQFMTESWVTQTVRVPATGIISYLSWGLDTAFHAGLTLALNVNSSSSSLAVFIGAAMTGLVTNNNSTDNITVDDGYQLDFVANASAANSDYTGGFYCISARFDSTDSTVGSAQIIAAVGPSLIYPGAELKYVSFLGILGNPMLVDADPTESNQRFKCLADGTWQNMACYVETNEFNRTTFIYNRVNGSDGSMAISIPAGTGGYVEDTSGASDSVSYDDLLDYVFVAPDSGNGDSLKMIWLGAQFVATNPALCIIGGSSGGPAPLGAGGSANFSPLFGGGEPANAGTYPQTRATGLIPYALTASHLTSHVTSADDSDYATITLLKNGRTTMLSISSGAGLTGFFTDLIDTADFTAGDTCANQITVTGESHTSVYWVSAGLLLEASA